MKKLVSTALLLIAAVLPGACKTAVILSTDIGNEIDDQWAVTYLLLSSQFDVRAIISAHAPSLPDPSAHATYRILVDVVERKLGMLSHPPLFEGSSLPLSDTRMPLSNPGVDFLISTAQQFTPENRLVVFTIGAATDVASALLKSPDIADRIRIVAMGFKSLTDGGKEYNIQNDPHAWQVILDSRVPVAIGSADVCQRDLAMSFDRARSFIAPRGALGAWLWQEYQEWYFRSVKPLRKDDFSKPWIIWDTIVLAYEAGMTTQKEIPRPRLADNLAFEQAATDRTITWITAVDSRRMWDDFAAKLDYYQSTHAVDLSPCLLPHL